MRFYPAAMPTFYKEKIDLSLIFSFYQILAVNKNETKRTIFDTL
jgi:hypothetical protein